MNIPPNTGTTPHQIRRRNEAATDWLNKHDKKFRQRKKFAQLQDRRDKAQADKNPALVATYRRAMLRTK